MHFQTDYPGAVAAFKGEAGFTLAYSRDRLLHCLDQLDEPQVWQRAAPGMNAVGNVVLHVAGNLRQWITVGCDPTRSLPDGRDRPAEFSATFGMTPGQLADHLRAAVDDATATVHRLNKDHLLEPRTIQGFEVTGMGAVWHSVSHLEGHAQETVFATRLILGDAYRFKDAY
ncbi:MAG: DUF664 domain-containing protein [Planctomycetota bacterium]